MENKYFVLFACCIPVNGAKRHIVCDLQRSTYLKIPDSLYYILTRLKNKPISYIKAQFPEQRSKAIDDYFNFLVENEFGFFSDTYHEFPEIQISAYYDYKMVSDAIIDYDRHSSYSIQTVINQLSTLLCESLELRFFAPVSKDFIENVLTSTQGSALRSISIVMHDSDYVDETYCLSLAKNHPRLSFMVVHSSEKNATREGDGLFVLHHTKEKVLSESCCGVVSPSYFVINTKSFIEAKNHNSCLNKKISVDKNGFIKNCPSMTVNYGHIASNTLENALNNETFKKSWNITKDVVEVCSDCEFRYICPDCRVYLTSENELSKPSKCNYNPYE